MENTKTKYVAYYRVSTKQQGKSGLGLESQESIVTTFAKNHDGVITDSFLEIESGKNNNRIELNKAISRAKETNAVLLIAKIDRLSRNASFVMQLRDSGVQFVAADMPEANTLTIGIISLLAQQERELISERTKSALQQLKAKGVQLGNDNLTAEGREKSKLTRKLNATKRSKQSYSLIRMMRKQGDSYRKIATYLNDNGFFTPTGKKFYANSVKQVESVFEVQND